MAGRWQFRQIDCECYVLDAWKTWISSSNLWNGGIFCVWVASYPKTCISTYCWALTCEFPGQWGLRNMVCYSGKFFTSREWECSHVLRTRNPFSCGYVQYTQLYKSKYISEPCSLDVVLWNMAMRCWDWNQNLMTYTCVDYIHLISSAQWWS